VSAPSLTDAALRATLYAALHRGTPGDLAFHLAACEGGRRVLELGCGAGRIALPLARAGHEVLALDLDAALLDIARARARRLPASARARLLLREGDMRALDLGEQVFDRVVLAHSTLYCLQSDDEVRAMLGAVRAHLAPGGRLSIDAYAADELHESLDPDAEDPLEEVARITVAGRRWRVLERSDWDRPAQRLDVLYRHVPEDGGPVVDTTIVHRYLRAAELEALLRAEGFSHVRVLGDFGGAPYGEGAEQMVVVASR
jgi:SAM-dependent methyltransferase